MSSLFSVIPKFQADKQTDWRLFRAEHPALGQPPWSHQCSPDPSVCCWRKSFFSLAFSPRMMSWYVQKYNDAPIFFFTSLILDFKRWYKINLHIYQVALSTDTLNGVYVAVQHRILLRHFLMADSEQIWAPTRSWYDQVFEYELGHRRTLMSSCYFASSALPGAGGVLIFLHHYFSPPL